MILLIIYSLFLILATVAWLSVQVRTPEQSDEQVSVIVVVRNEEENITALLESLRSQTHSALEIILVDDQSTDRTVELAKKMQLANLRILHLQEAERGTAPKKAGIEKAVREAGGSLIFSTDGDCVLPPGLIAFYAGLFRQPELLMLVGPVTFTAETHPWNQVQTVEFSSLMGSAALAIFLKKPIMCSAANLAYRKSAFLETGGYQTNSANASGDDEFLMNTIHRTYPGSVLFVKHSNCIVTTRAAPTLRAFFHQRKRWAGKRRLGTNAVSRLTAVLVFLVNAITIGYMVTGKWEVVLFRFLCEALFLSAVLLFFERKRAIAYIPLTQLIYPFYAVFFGILSLIPSAYTWKERRLQ